MMDEMQVRNQPHSSCTRHVAPRETYYGKNRAIKHSPIGNLKAINLTICYYHHSEELILTVKYADTIK